MNTNVIMDMVWTLMQMRCDMNTDMRCRCVNGMQMWNNANTTEAPKQVIGYTKKLCSLPHTMNIIPKPGFCKVLMSVDLYMHIGREKAPT